MLGVCPAPRQGDTDWPLSHGDSLVVSKHALLNRHRPVDRFRGCPADKRVRCAGG